MRHLTLPRKHPQSGQARSLPGASEVQGRFDDEWHHLVYITESVLAPAVEPMHVEPSRVIGGYTKVFGELGRGGMGVVYRACEQSVGRLVALKVIHSSRFQEGDGGPRRAVLLERFLEPKPRPRPAWTTKISPRFTRWGNLRATRFMRCV